MDDNELNVEAALHLGMHAVHFRSNEQAIPEIRAALGRRDARLGREQARDRLLE